MDNIPEIPEDITSLTKEELATLREEVAKFIEENAESVTSAEELAKLTELVESHDAIKAREAEIEAEETQLAESAANLIKRVKGEADGEGDPQETQEGQNGEGDPEPEADPAKEGEGEPAKEDAEGKELVTASAKPKAQARRAPASPAKAMHSLVAAANGKTVDKLTVARELIDAYRRNNGNPQVVAQITASGDKSPELGSNPDENWEIVASGIDKHTAELTEIVAAGGLCAPTEGYYDIFTLGSDVRPVANSLPTFRAARGGIRFQAPPTLASITTDAVDMRTEAQDAAGTPAKTCLTVTCGSDVEVLINAFYRCLEFGNFGARAYPELVQSWLDLAAVAQARLAEQELLDGIAAGSTAVAAASTLAGGGRQVLQRVAQAAAGYRSRNRLNRTDVLNVYLPTWVREYVQADFAVTIGGPEVLDALDEFDAGMGRLNLNVTYYLDSATGAGQVFGAQGAAVIVDFPTTLVAYIHAPGTFIRLDGGTLDLGTVRDSTLNADNNFQIFAETFENVAKVGSEALALTITSDNVGSYAAAVTVTPDA